MTKEIIITRLIKEGHITLQEALVLLETQTTITYIPYSQTQPYNPPYYISCSGGCDSGCNCKLK